jgi:multicomponent Na+:H+ antiporter subunit E
MSTVATIIVMALLWAGINGNFSEANLIFGAVIGLVAVLLLRQSLVSPGLGRRVVRITKLCASFVYELMASAVKVAALVVRPDMLKVIRPAFVKVPLTVKSDAEITVLANLVTLTPGTLSVDVSEDKKFLYVHTISLESREALIAEIANGFEKQVKDVFQ